MMITHLFEKIAWVKWVLKPSLEQVSEMASTILESFVDFRPWEADLFDKRMKPYITSSLLKSSRRLGFRKVGRSSVWETVAWRGEIA